MSIQKTLGGDRLGSGNKMKVELHNYERSTHDLSRTFRSTMAVGTLVPFMTEIALPGDTWDINLNTLVRTVPTLAPLFGSFKLQLDVFTTPIRLYNAQLHMNRVNVGLNINNIKLPIMNLQCSGAVHPDMFEPSSLIAYLGVRGAPPVKNGTVFPDTNNGMEKSALFLLNYWSIYKNYYSNKQEKIGYVISNGSYYHWTIDYLSQESTPGSGSWNSYLVESSGLVTTPVTISSNAMRIEFKNGDIPNLTQLIVTMRTPSGAIFSGYLTNLFNTTFDTNITKYLYIEPKGNLTGYVITNLNPAVVSNTTALAVQKFDLENIDQTELELLQHDISTPFMIHGNSLQPYKQCVGTTWPQVIQTNYSSQNGLALKTYQSDIFNNWLDTTFISDITTKSSVNTQSGSFSIDALNFSKKLYEMYNRVVVSGNTYNDWQEAIWGEESFRLPETPIYCGGLSTEILFEEVVSTVDTTVDVSGTPTPIPLGSLAGKGVQSGNKKGGNVYIKVTEPSLIMGIVSITPRIDYCQGNKWHTNLKTLDDLHKPQLSNIGFQEAITEQFAAWDSVYDDTTNTFTFRSAGKQPAWLNYMTSYNEVYGNFAKRDGADALGQCVLTRDYQMSPGYSISDLTSYINPTKFNYAFAQKDISAQNFWVQIAMNIEARRKVSAKLMPNL